MFSSLLPLIPLLWTSSVAAQSVSVVCVAGQCLEGYTNITLGATLSASGYSTSLQLLPGEYTSTTNPELLHELLTSSSAALSASDGFSVNKSVSLPFDISLQPGVAVYSGANYSGDASFNALPTNVSTNSTKHLSAGSLALASDVWMSVSGASSNDRIVLWSSVPDVSQLPSSSLGNSLTLLDMQSTACSSPCSSGGICSTSGKCVCQSGFTGSSCESCASGHFGPSCEACPVGCLDCDDGISGTGKCLKFNVTNAPSTCNCVNGVCNSNGQCTCNAGWTASSNGTACATCAKGYFLDSSGNCEICALGCEECANGTGDCITCESGFTQSSNAATQCIATQQTTSGGTQCPDGSFSNGASCEQCSSLCQTCTGATSNDCIICATGSYRFNGSCLSASSSGVCENSNMIANNNKHECDSCSAKCTKCEIPNFTTASTTNQAQCTGCVAGFVLSNGTCIESCPTGTFLSPKDNLTCTACDSSCGTCAGSSDFCLTCTNNQLASNGTCTSSCPSNTVSSSGACLACHPDCATCTGTSFNQCSGCPSDRPVLNNGRCLPTCSQSGFFDTASSSCQSCDSSCLSCSGSGPNNCLACSSSSQILRGGTCVSAGCSNSSSVISGLGLCLSDLVATVASGTASTPLPTITGINSNTKSTTATSLAWWQILLMTLGCAFIFLVIVILWRRRMRRKRAQATMAFAAAKRLDRPRGWRLRLLRFGERLFGNHHPNRKWMVPDEERDIKLERMRGAEEQRHLRTMEKLGGSSRQPSPLPSLGDYRDDGWEARKDQRGSLASMSNESLYTHITGQPRRTPEPRQPARNPRELLPSRFSDTTLGSHEVRRLEKDRAEQDRSPTPAQEYARSWMVQEEDTSRGSYWLKPSNTGGSKNPFRR
ncbi:uncharacterized protein C8Q71DRAFT_801907 [Rhodofomes roseus]|uniref:EGF-like domain-containing protein n=1 Tax=Rhodofomes roseus TaxID=34475 RepID=A0ABQ8KUI3_9APHY|nr:uncharacterized protein C8Q71DRAFT_801907 [Rhodofomes roseus]KAH9842471.1 hypothetical protein C8Q71DRAFT_801907 [Rhodofomes roseus]